jgi:phage gpG-like protein
MARVGKSGNKILQDSGRLRQGLMPNNWRGTDEGLIFYNRVPYANAHDKGVPKRNLPSRPFMWLSKEAKGALAV